MQTSYIDPIDTAMSLELGLVGVLLTLSIVLVRLPLFLYDYLNILFKNILIYTYIYAS